MKLLFGIILISSMALANIVLPQSFKSRFKQIVTNTHNGVIVYSGKVYFSDNKYFKWSYLKPTKKEVCTNSKELLVIDHDLEQVSEYRINNGLNISKVLNSAKHYKDSIYTAVYDGKIYTIQLDSKNRLQSIAYFDELDNKVQILFMKMKYKNSKLSTKQMECIYPKNYDIIRG